MTGAPSAAGEPTERADRRASIVAAIENKRTLAFTYNGRRREVEPQCLGLGARGTELLRGHQLKGGREPEPLFAVDRMSDLEVLARQFELPGPHYKRGDSAMKTILAEL